jgi:hypothetical protein
VSTPESSGLTTDRWIPSQESPAKKATRSRGRHAKSDFSRRSVRPPKRRCSVSTGADRGVCFSRDVVMYWLSDVAAPHLRTRTMRVAPHRGAARFAFWRLSVATPYERGHPFSAARLEAARSDARGVVSGTSSPLPKRHPGRKAGSQSHGSLGDRQATEEAPSADQPKSFPSGEGGGAVCQGF